MTATVEPQHAEVRLQHGGLRIPTAQVAANGVTEHDDGAGRVACRHGMQCEAVKTFHSKRCHAGDISRGSACCGFIVNFHP